MRTVEYATLFIAALFFCIGSLPADAAPITPGSVLLYRVGDGGSALSDNGNPVFIDEYDSNGLLLQSLPMPTTASDGNFQLIASRSTTEGMITVSPNGQFVGVMGYASDLGGELPMNGTSSATISRTIGIINTTTGVVDTTTTLNNVSTSHPRSAVTTNGTDIWVSINGTGIRPTTLGATSADASIHGTVRLAHIFDGQLYAASSAGIGAIGTGIPTSPGQTFNLLPGTDPPGGASSFDGNMTFFFADLDAGVAGVDTLYVAGDDNIALTKYSLVDGTWTSNGTIGTDANNYRGVTGSVDGSTVTIYAVYGAGSSGGGNLVKLVDASGYNGAFAGTPTTLATAPENIAFRGVAYAPTPVFDVPGDFNGDGNVDGLDFVAWQSNFPMTSGADLEDGDADGDGDVDGADFVVWQTNFPFTSSAGIIPVPEPSAILLLMAGLGIGWLGRRGQLAGRSL